MGGANISIASFVMYSICESGSDLIRVGSVQVWGLEG